MKTSIDIRSIAAMGCNISLVEKQSASEMKPLLQIIQQEGSHLTIKGNDYSISDLQYFSGILGDQLTVLL
jgi:hypothetical protein